MLFTIAYLLFWALGLFAKPFDWWDLAKIIIVDIILMLFSGSNQNIIVVREKPKQKEDDEKTYMS